MSENWVNKIEEDVKNVDTAKEMEQWKKLSIYKIPSCITQLCKTPFASSKIVPDKDYLKPLGEETTYTPQVVSFGPHHHVKNNLKPMEEHKHRALLHFLKRSNKSIKSIVEHLKGIVQDLKDSYDQLSEKWQKNDNDFIQLMIVDGCFMLEILYFPAYRMSSSNNYAWNDPIFSDHGMLNMMTFIIRDMLKLENQLPMAVLYNLAHAETNEDKMKVNNVILHFFFPNKKDFSPPLTECLHILDAYRKILINGSSSSEPHGGDISIAEFQVATRGRDVGNVTPRSATDLGEAGIKFQESTSRSIKDISFRGGILRLPFVGVDDAFESTFLNLLAFERFHAGAGSEVTSYVYFMDTLLAHKTDVALLQSIGLIENAIGSNHAVSQMFHLLAKEIALDPKSSLRLVMKQISDHYQKPWNRLRNFVIHTYVHNRCPILSLIVATIIFGLAASQTLFTIYPYYHPRGK